VYWLCITYYTNLDIHRGIAFLKFMGLFNNRYPFQKSRGNKTCILLQATWSWLAEGYVEARLLLQECEVGNVSNNDGSQSLHVAVQRQDYLVHGKVSKSHSFFLKGITDFWNIWTHHWERYGELLRRIAAYRNCTDKRHTSPLTTVALYGGRD